MAPAEYRYDDLVTDWVSSRGLAMALPVAADIVAGTEVVRTEVCMAECIVLDTGSLRQQHTETATSP